MVLWVMTPCSLVTNVSQEINVCSFPLSFFLSFFLFPLLYFYFSNFVCILDRLCDLVVRVPGYRSRGPGSIPDTTRFSEKQWVRNRVRSASCEYN
jgi:hypothetical protein